MGDWFRQIKIMGFQTHIPNCNNSSSSNNNQNPSFPMEDPLPCNNPLSQQDHAAAAALDMELQQQFSLEMEQSNYTNIGNNNDIQEMVNDSNSWQDMADNFQTLEYPQNGHFITTNCSSLPSDGTMPYAPTTPDLFNMFPFPRCSTLLPDSSMTLPINPAHRPPSFLASLGLLGELNKGSLLQFLPEIEWSCR